MSSVTEQRFANCYNEMISKAKLTEDIIEDLFDLFGDQFFDILPVLKKSYIQKITAPSSRYIFRVENIISSNKSMSEVKYNFCFVAGNHCNCSPFKFDVCKRENSLWCIHLIAAKIALAINCFETLQVEENEFKDIFRLNMLGIE